MKESPPGTMHEGQGRASNGPAMSGSMIRGAWVTKSTLTPVRSPGGAALLKRVIASIGL